MLRQALLKGKNWQLIARQQKARQFGDTAHQAAAASLASLSQTFDFLCELDSGVKGERGSTQSSQQQQQLQDVSAIPLLVECSRKVGLQLKAIVAGAES